MNTGNEDEMVEFIEALQRWHESKTRVLQTILDHKDADIRIGENLDLIAGDSDIAKGLRVGVAIALEHLGKLPFSITKKVTDEETEETEETD